MNDVVPTGYCCGILMQLNPVLNPCTCSSMRINIAPCYGCVLAVSTAVPQCVLVYKNIWCSIITLYAEESQRKNFLRACTQRASIPRTRNINLVLLKKLRARATAHFHTFVHKPLFVCARAQFFQQTRHMSTGHHNLMIL